MRLCQRAAYHRRRRLRLAGGALSSRVGLVTLRSACANVESQIYNADPYATPISPPKVESAKQVAASPYVEGSFIPLFQR